MTQNLINKAAAANESIKKYQDKILEQSFIIEVTKMAFADGTNQSMYEDIITKAVSRINAYKSAIQTGQISEPIRTDEKKVFMAQKGMSGEYVKIIQRIMRDFTGIPEQEVTGVYDELTWKRMVIIQLVYKQMFFPDLEVTGNVDEKTNNMLYRLSQGEKFKKQQTITAGEAYRQGVDDYFTGQLEQVKPLGFWEFFDEYGKLTDEDKKLVWSYVFGGITPDALTGAFAAGAARPVKEVVVSGAKGLKTAVSECAEFTVSKFRSQSGYWKPFNGAAKGLAKIGDQIGNLGKLVKHPGIKVDWSNNSVHGLQRMAERNISKEMVDNWVKNGKAIQQDSETYLFLTREGVAVVGKNGKLITAYSKNEFKDHIIRAIEMIYGK